MRNVQGMKTTATLLVGALLAAAPARADQAIGLQEDDLQAIRAANRENKDWLPPLSDPFRLLLLNRPHEAIQVVVEPQGRFFYRGPDLQFLTVADPPYNAQDYKNLVMAIKTSYYTYALAIVRGRSRFVFQSSPQLYLLAIRKWDQDVDQAVKNEGERESLRSLLGRTVLELPEDSQKQVMNNISEAARRAVEKARTIEQQKLKAIHEDRTGPMAPEADVHLLAGQLSHLASAPFSPSGIQLRVHTDDPRLLSVTLEAGKKAFVKADSPGVAKDLAATGNLSKLAEMADEGKVTIYVDRGAGQAVEQVSGSGLSDQLKAVQANKK
jgi:hypothetical protein